MEKRARFWFGLVFGALAAVVLVVGMIRDQPAVMAGAFIGGLVAGNVIPYSELRALVPWGRG